MKTIEIYTISELQEYSLSDQYRNSAALPVSPERIVSYMKNPRAKRNMPVLFILSENDRILAYRTLLPDTFEGRNGISEFAWLSGNYVDPSQRRTGLSTKLFNAVEEAWSGKLMYTNYAPASKAVYDKTDSFVNFAERPGKRYYMRSSLRTHYKDRIKADGLLKFGDSLVNGLHDPQLNYAEYKPVDGIEFLQIESMDEEILQLIVTQQEQSLFKRGPGEFEWIHRYPWLTEEPKELAGAAYHFSRKVSKFSGKWFGIKSKDACAFLWITHVENKTSVPYFFHNNRMLVLAARQIVLSEMLQNKSAYISIRHPELGPVLGTRKNPFLLARNMPQRYFAHKNLVDLIPKDKTILDGDGDCVFT